MKRILLLLSLPLLSLSLFAESGQQCPKVMNRAAISATSSGDNTLIAADTDRKIVVWKFFIVNSHATQDESLTWKEGSTAVSGAYLLKANGGAQDEPCDGTGFVVAPKGSAVILNLSAAGTIKGQIWYTLEQP